MSLEDLRKRIDDIDASIVRLIAERIRIAQEVGMRKNRTGKRIEDRGRENKVLEHVRSIAEEESICQEDIENIYRQIVTACKRVQGV